MPEDGNGRTAASPPVQPGDGEPRVGVYTCYCGGNISDVVNCEGTAKALEKIPGVVVSRTHMAMCSDAGQAMIEADIKENGVNRVVIGACSPSLHEATFRGTVARAGLNPYLYYHVGLREQDSWVHGNDPQGATEKAIRLMSAGIAKAKQLEPLEAIQLTAEQHALVIGGGIAGLRASLDIARRGIQVTLIEKSPFLGGRVAQLEKVFPNDQPGRELLHTLIQQVISHPKITVLTQAELVSVAGYVGDYQVQVRQRPRGVQAGAANLQAAIDACPVNLPDEFNYGLTQRKAIYRRYEGCYPPTPAIDWEHCTRCEECAKISGQQISLDDTPRTIELRVGAMVVATGFDPYEPAQGEYGYGELPEVITLAQLIRVLALTEHGKPLEWRGRRIQDVAMIHCVGSRQIDGIHAPQSDGQVNPYCSRVCCTANLHVTCELHDRYPQLHIYDLYQDIRTYGRGHEDYYTQSSANGVRFLRYHPDEIPEVSPAPKGDSNPVLVRVKDHLTDGLELELPVDLVVLVTGMMPRSIEELTSLLKISPGTDRFLLEVHPKLRPVETAVPGVILAGTAQGPMNIQESVAASSAAAAKVAGLIGLGQVELEPFVARVDPERCDGAGACVEVCAYENAIALQEFGTNGKTVRHAVVTPANCVGCGACVSACPNQAIDVQGWTLKQYEAMVAAIASQLPILEMV